MDEINLKHELTLLLEKEVGFTGKFILEKQCRSLDIDPEKICPEDLDRLATKVTWAIRSYTGDKRAEEIKKDILEYKKAIQIVDSAVEKSESSSEHVEAQLVIANKKLAVGMLEDALEALESAKGLLSEFPKSQAKPFEVKITRLEARILTRQPDMLDKAMDLYKKVIQMGRGTGQHYDVALSWAGLGAISWRFGEHEEALEQYHNALKTLEPFEALSRKDKEKKNAAEALMKSGLGNVYLDLLDYDSSIRYNEEAIELFKRLDNGAEVGRVYNNLARVYEETGNFPRAIDRYERAIKYTRDSGELRMEGWALTNLASTLVAYGKHQEAREHLERAEKALRDFDDPIAHSKLNCMWGKYHRERGEWSNAIERFTKCIDFIKDIRAPDYLAIAQEEFGIMYMKKGDPGKAKPLLEKALAWFKQKNEIPRIQKIEKMLAKL